MDIGDMSRYGMTPGRWRASVAALVGLVGLVTGARALARPRGIRNRRRQGVVSMAAGLTGAGLGALVVATAGGGLATGHGMGGGIVALVAGLIGVVLGALVVARAGRPG